jgi:hypothetical protein
MVWTFFQTYWLDIIISLVVAAVLILLWRRGKKDLVKKFIYSLVVQAEKQLGSKTGQEKFAAVMAAIYQRIPFIIRFFFSQQNLTDFIEWAVAKLKERLATGEVNLLSYQDEQFMLKAAELEDEISNVSTE